MNKRELYEWLKGRGITLPSYKNVTLAELEKMYGDCLQDEECAAPEGEPSADAESGCGGLPPVLHFPGGGWCEELGTSYFMGYYRPASWREYDILRRYASEVRND
jgi:hypothetical protein